MVTTSITRIGKRNSEPKKLCRQVSITIQSLFLSLIIGLLLNAEPARADNFNDSTYVIDGPYVMYRGDSILVYYIDSANGKLAVRTEHWPASKKDSVRLKVHTDIAGNTFQVKLSAKISSPKSTYGTPKKMLVVSDIEGNFSSLRKLLQGNGVMDDQYRWTFEKGHLVLLGDFIDRGTMVTEVLWLLYHLEAQAEASGGKLHYILGNHEIMNMNGDLRYVHPRYLAYADTMKLPYLQLYSTSSELGRWLSSKNIMETIGRGLFIHSGISPYFNVMAVPPGDLNDTARIYFYDTSSVDLPSPVSNLLFSDYSPFWYRGYYYGDPRATQSQVDSTLSLYQVHYIVTGHTLISKQITSLYNRKVYNLDVPHYQGISEALLIEGNKLYRVNSSGTKNEIREMNNPKINSSPHD